MNVDGKRGEKGAFAAKRQARGQAVEPSAAWRNTWPSLRGQAAVEFFTYISFFLLVFASASFIFMQQQAQEVKLNEYLLAKEIGSQFADDINFALAAGPGFRANFTFPKKILDRPYNMTLTSSGFAYLTWKNPNGEFSYAFPMNTGAFGAGTGISRYVSGGVTHTVLDGAIAKGCMNLENDAGAIKISTNCNP